jgi:tetratricopeptide (TPR) repeat protein
MVRRVRVMGIVGLLCMAAASSTAAQEDLSAIVKKVEPSVVGVLIYDKEGRTIQRGSGFFLGGEGNIITNRDLFKGADHADVETADGMLYPVRKVLAEDREANLIRISVEIPPAAVHPPPLNPSLPQIGEKVVAVGNPSGPGKPFSYGMVLSLREIPAFGKVLQVMIRLSSRFIGGPLVNMKGEVIAIVASERGQTFDVFPVERVMRLAPGKGKPLSDWEAQGEKAAEELYAAGLPYLWKEDYEKAIPLFKEAAKKDPRYANAYFQIGYCNAQQRHYREAIEAYKRAIRIQPEFVFAHFYLGLAYLELNDRNSALKQYDTLKKMGRQNADRDYASDLYNMIE